MKYFDDLKYIDYKNNMVYFMASPNNATQSYLYKTKLDGKGKLELLSPKALQGKHDYNVSRTGGFAIHSFTNSFTKPASEIILFQNHQPINAVYGIEANLSKLQETQKVEFFKVTTSEGVEMDGWMVKPTNFDATKKYPVVFYVYTEPASTKVNDTYGVANNPNCQIIKNPPSFPITITGPSQFLAKGLAKQRLAAISADILR